MISSGMLKVPEFEAPQGDSWSDRKVHGLEEGEELPKNVNVTQQWQLEGLPEKFLSGDPIRPLLSHDDIGNSYKHALKPMLYSVIFILIVEGLERLSFYGVNFTQTYYLQGKYNPEWSANLTAVEAATWVSTSTAIAYCVPFVGAILADGFIGNYFAILLGAILFYLPGLLLIALSAQPGALGEEFNTTAVEVAFLFLYPVGAGLIKASVSVFGAQQFHPLLQTVEQYYVRFYSVINIGALIGGLTIPIICQHDVFAAYMIPVAGLGLAVLVFLSGTRRYVRKKPDGHGILTSVKASASSLLYCPPSLEKTKISNGGRYPDRLVEHVKLVGAVIPTTALIIPFNIVYAQMTTTFIIQGSAMESVSFIDPSWMQNFDAISVIIFGFLVSSFFYPFLERRNLSMHISTKFAVGTVLCALAVLSAIIIDYRIHAVYKSSGQQISVLWQIFPFLFIGCGEIFAISTAYEAAFVIAPPDQKALASAINLFLIGAVPNFICTALVNGCAVFFQTPSGSTKLKTVEDYTSARVYLYFWILFGIAMGGAVICLLPPVKKFLSKIEEKQKILELEHAH